MHLQSVVPTEPKSSSPFEQMAYAPACQPAGAVPKLDCSLHLEANCLIGIQEMVALTGEAEVRSPYFCMTTSNSGGV